jgi:hypothetical protein
VRLRLRDPWLRAKLRRQRQFLCRREFARRTTAVQVDPAITRQSPSNPRPVGDAILKITAASRTGIPPSTAASTRSRKSCE